MLTSAVVQSMTSAVSLPSYSNYSDYFCRELCALRVIVDNVVPQLSTNTFVCSHFLCRHVKIGSGYNGGVLNFVVKSCSFENCFANKYLNY